MSAPAASPTDADAAKLTRYQQSQLKSKQTPHNHTASHVLYNTLIRTFDTSFGQLVSVDYTHPFKAELTVEYKGDAALTPEELLRVQAAVNDGIQANRVIEIFPQCTEQHTQSTGELIAFYILKTKRRANKGQYDFAYIVGSGATELLNKQAATPAAVDTATAQLGAVSLQSTTSKQPRQTNTMFGAWKACSLTPAAAETNVLVETVMAALKHVSAGKPLDLSDSTALTSLATQLSQKFEPRLNMYQNIAYTHGYQAGSVPVQTPMAHMLKRM